MGGGKVSQDIKEAIAEYKKDNEALQESIIYGHIQPAELAKILSALQDQNISTLSLMLTVGEGKFIEASFFRPLIPMLYTAGGAIITLGISRIASTFG